LGRRFVLTDRGGAEEASAARFGLWAATLLTAAMALVFVRQLVEFHDPFATWAEDASLLLGATDWGRSWKLGSAATLLSVVGFWLALQGKRAGWGVATAAVLAVGAFPAFTGHANVGDLRTLTLLADTLHVWAAGGWAGGLALVLFLEVRQRRSAGGASPSLLPSLVPRFSRLALVSVAVLVATGVFASWVQLEGLGALFRTNYGRILLLKLALVAGMLGLGALNWRRLTPRLAEPAGARAMRRAAATELALAALVFAVTAILVRSSPTGP